MTAPVPVGAQPSMAVFTPDGNHLVVANTGEANDDYSQDPEGSVSIISLDERFGFLFTRVNTIHFDNLNERRDELIRAGVRLTGPNASVAQDLEPESIALSPDGRLAWVTLERNNALALIDIDSESLINILPLPYKVNSTAGSGLDASDVDGQINIRPWPGLRSWPQPDLIASFVSMVRSSSPPPTRGEIPRTSPATPSRRRSPPLLSIPWRSPIRRSVIRQNWAG